MICIVFEIQKMICKKHVYILFPHFKKSELNARVRFMLNTTYINNLYTYKDLCDLIYTVKPKFEDLYQNYLKTHCIPYFNKWVVSFVKHVDKFVENKNSTMYICYEELLINWS